MTELLNALNDRQREAVTYCDGPELVIAGAGSGKTRVLTYKIAYLLESGYQPWNILALTFTNKAAREMKERIGRLVGQQKAKQLVMGTFHSVFAHILRVEAASIGYDSNYTIYDETDSRSLIKSIVKGLGLDDKTYKPATVHSRISMAKNHLITADGYAQDHSALERDIVGDKGYRAELRGGLVLGERHIAKRRRVAHKGHLDDVAACLLCMESERARLARVHSAGIRRVFAQKLYCGKLYGIAGRFLRHLALNDIVGRRRERDCQHGEQDNNKFVHVL